MGPRRTNTNNEDGGKPVTSLNRQECKASNVRGNAPTPEAMEAGFQPQRHLVEDTSSAILPTTNNKNNTTNTLGSETTDCSNNKTTSSNTEANKDQEMGDLIDSTLYSALYSVIEQSSDLARSNNNNKGSYDDDWSDSDSRSVKASWSTTKPLANLYNDQWHHALLLKFANDPSGLLVFMNSLDNNTSSGGQTNNNNNSDDDDDESPSSNNNGSLSPDDTNKDHRMDDEATNFSATTDFSVNNNNTPADLADDPSPWRMIPINPVAIEFCTPLSSLNHHPRPHCDEKPIELSANDDPALSADIMQEKTDLIVVSPTKMWILPVNPANCNIDDNPRSHINNSKQFPAWHSIKTHNLLKLLSGSLSHSVRDRHPRIVHH